ncbi:MAG: potassium channel family protein [Desulfomonilia bacterium]
MEIRQKAIADRLKYVFLLLAFVFFTGTIGFHFIEGWSFLDSFFMTLITITTIGYREIYPLSDGGKLFDVMIIFLGVGSAAYGFASIAQFVVEGEVQRVLGRRRLDKKITQMNDHYIICGNGRIGSLISQELHKHKKTFVVIDRDPAAIESLERVGIPYVMGDATSEDTLIKAGIQRAKALIATASSDMTNVYIILIAKELNPVIFVLARAETEDSTKNLRRAGANKVISPYMIGGRHMANIILKPTVVDFIELATGEKMEDFIIQMEGFKIKRGSSLLGQTLKNAPIRKNLGLIVVAVKDSSGKMIFNPSADYTISESDVLVCIGSPDALQSMKKLSIS